MAERSGNRKKLKRSHRKLIRIFAVVVFVLFFLQVGLYFGSDWLLRSYLQQKVEEASDGKYIMDFDRFNLSLLERGCYFRGFVLLPVDELALKGSDRPYYKINVPEIALKGFNYNFSEKVVEIASLSFTKPMIASRQDESLAESGNESALSLLEEEIRRSFSEVNLKEIKIGDLYINEADFLMENFLSQRAMKAENTNFHVRNVYLMESKDPPTPFNAEGFSFGMEHFEMLLADSIHTIKAEAVHVSSLDNVIKAKKIQLDPDVTRHSEVYYDVQLDDLELTDADINRVFYTSDVNIGSLKLNKPKFSLFSELSAQQEAVQDYSLYPLIKDILASISIKDLEITKGEYLQRSIKDAYKNRIEAAEINFEMDEVYIGPDVDKQVDQFFYAQDAVLDLSKVKVTLADGVHWITGEKVFLSSKEDSVRIEGVKVEPYQEAEEDVTLLEIEVPSLSLGNANLKMIYNENILDIREMIISSPSVLFANIKKGNEQQVNSTLRELTEDYLKAIYIDRLQLDDGDMVLSNRLQLRQDSLSFGKVSFVLENFMLDEQKDDRNNSRIFLAEDLQLEIEDYALKLSDNLHLFSADRIFVDTKEKYLKIDGFRFVPLEADKVRQNLQRLGRTTALDIHIPEFYVRGIDIPTAYFNERLLVEQIDIPSPDIKISRYIEKGEESEKIERSDIYRLLTSYFSLIQVDSVSLIEGSIAYDNFVGDRIQTFAENDVSIHVKNFSLGEDGEDLPGDSDILFAEELDISLDNYVFNIADGKYTVRADRIRYNSSQDELITSNVQLRPRRDLGMKVAIGADIPHLVFKGVDLEAFLFDNTLSLSTIRLSDSGVDLFIDKSQDDAEEPPLQEEKKDRNLPKTIEVIRIDTLEAANASFGVHYSHDEGERELINTGINLSIYGFLLDSTKLQQGDIAAFFSHMSMDIDDFSLSLRDSVHTINFSKVELDTESDEIVLENFRITPVDLIGKPGIPVISAQIPSVHLKTKSLTTLQQTGDFHVQELRLEQPAFIVYLDDQEMDDLQGKEDKEIVQNVIKQLNVDSFRLNKGSLDLRKKENGDNIYLLGNLSLTLDDLSFDFSNGAGINKKFFLNKEYELEIPNFVQMLPDSLNLLRIGLIKLSGNDMVLKDVSLTPRYGRYQYAQELGYQADVIQAQIPEVVFESLDIERLLDRDEIIADKMLVNYPVLEVFRDKRYPLQELTKPMPQKLMRESGIYMDVDSLIVRSGKVSYTEFPEKGMVPGNIFFDSMEVKMSPFHLRKQITDEYPDVRTKLQADALLNGVGHMGVTVNMQFEDPFPMKVNAEVDGFDLKLINSMLATNAFARIREGVVRPSSWSFDADDDRSRGKMTLKYNDLSLGLLNERTLEKGKGRKRMLNFVLNAFAVRSNNPRKIFNRLVPSEIHFERDKRKFIFNYWWKSTFSGVKGSLGLGEQPPVSNEEVGD